MIHIEMCGASEAGRYILKGVTDALFLDFRNYHNRITVKNIADVAPRGVVYTLRSVLRGLSMSSLAHFTVSIYSNVGVYSVCLPLLAVVGHESRTGRS